MHLRQQCLQLLRLLSLHVEYLLDRCENGLASLLWNLREAEFFVESSVLLFARRELLHDVDQLNAIFKVALDHLLLDTIGLGDFGQGLSDLVLEGLLILEIPVVKKDLNWSLDNGVHEVSLIDLSQLGYLVLNLDEVC